MVYFKENYNFTRFLGVGVGWGGSPTFSRRAQLFPGGSNFFQGGMAGVQMLILATQRTVIFQEGGADPLSHPSGSAHVAI